MITPDARRANEPELTRDHVARADLPWRKSDTTECGRPIASVTTCVSMGEVNDRVRRLGKQHTAFTVCLTCWRTGVTYKTWQQDPLDVVHRYSNGWRREADDRFRDELRAIAALIDAHRDEFDGYLAGLADTVDLASRRRLAR